MTAESSMSRDRVDRGILPSGDRAMRTPFALLPWLLVLMAAAGLACPVAAEDKDLRDKVLALNNVTGNKPLENKIKELIGDKEAAKKLVTAGAKVATEKDQPLNYNALLILASTAHPA